MRLIEQLVKLGLKNYLDDEINGKMSVWKFYKIHQLSCVALKKKPLKQEQLNFIWKIYNRKPELKQRIEYIFSKRILNNEFHDVSLFLKKAESLVSEEMIETDFSQKGVIGIASWGYDD